jgi:hypothetical protein
MKDSDHSRSNFGDLLDVFRFVCADAGHAREKKHWEYSDNKLFHTWDHLENPRTGQSSIRSDRYLIFATQN